MKERPILFSAPMVRALLDGSKTQTRRVVKTQPDEYAVMLGDQCLLVHDSSPGMHNSELISCPYGQPGDRLWVRETFAMYPYAGNDGAAGEVYRANGNVTDEMLRALGRKWTPSIHMPRWASRIDLEITGVRVERLQDCSEADAKAEGAEPYDVAGLTAAELALLDAPLMDPVTPYKNGYALLWESLNGPGSWDANPWVWVIEFRRVKP
jgi:hypothetical protein